MKSNTIYTLTILVIFVAASLSTGCKKPNEKGDKVASTFTQNGSGDAHATMHKTKYNEVLVEFPGHAYAMEIIDAKETTGLVSAFLTDAHFDPVEVDTQEVRLNFIVGGKPKVFTLVRAPQETGKPATFTLTDMELATLNCEGWEGEATASVEINGTPYNAKLEKLNSGEAHAH
ncbi:MAG: hypothetical protein ACRC2T_17985 [Thermoguttaceae bacterium]